jgi:hypothetical protein
LWHELANKALEPTPPMKSRAPRLIADVRPLNVAPCLSGGLVGNIRSKTALQLIRRWALLHRAELAANWAYMKAGKPLDKIPPLE